MKLYLVLVLVVVDLLLLICIAQKQSIHFFGFDFKKLKLGEFSLAKNCNWALFFGGRRWATQSYLWYLVLFWLRCVIDVINISRNKWYQSLIFCQTRKRVVWHNTFEFRRNRHWRWGLKMRMEDEDGEGGKWVKVRKLLV